MASYQVTKTTLASWGLAVTIALAASAPAAGADRASTPDTARFLAGQQPSDASPLAAAARSTAFKRHAQGFDSAWNSLEKRQLWKIREWSKENLTQSEKTMLYLFSGPDFLYAEAFFPNAATYIFAGLEPVGEEPDLAAMSEGQRTRGLQHLQSSINTVLRLSFFKTIEMREKLRGQGFPGTIPVLYTFLARAGKTVESVARLKLETDGKLRPPEAKETPDVARIEFSSPGSKQRQTLYYFSTDLSNSGLKKSGFLAFCRGHGSADALVKSASYLMHNASFSDSRDFLLATAKRIVQDDSGVPLRNFEKAAWEITPYGNYTGPIPLFSGRYQRDMTALFKSSKRRPLAFGMGYRYRPGDTSILLASRK